MRANKWAEDTLPARNFYLLKVNSLLILYFTFDTDRYYLCPHILSHLSPDS